jgi:hypothetical protein
MTNDRMALIELVEKQADGDNQTGIAFHPPVVRRMIDRDPALGHDLLEVAIDWTLKLGA